MNVKLGVCIPTYKRPELLYKTVKSIIKSGKEYEVPIFITDDSTDETNELIIKKLQQEYSYIFYTKNSINLGIDANIVHSINVTSTEYCWIIGEDDLIIENGIKIILDIINSMDSDVGFIVSNYSYVSNTHENIIRKYAIDLDKNNKIDLNSFLLGYLKYIGFIGACIINKSLWSKVDSKQYFGTYYAHVGTIIESLKDDKYIFINSLPLVLNRAEDISTFTWSDKAFDVFFGWERMLKILSIKLELNQNELDAIIDKNCFVFLKTLASKRSESIYNLNVFQKHIINNEYKSVLFKISAFFIAIMPVKSMQILRKIILGR